MNLGLAKILPIFFLLFIGCSPSLKRLDHNLNSLEKGLDHSFIFNYKQINFLSSSASISRAYIKDKVIYVVDSSHRQVNVTIFNKRFKVDNGIGCKWLYKKINKDFVLEERYVSGYGYMMQLESGWELWFQEYKITDSMKVFHDSKVSSIKGSFSF